MLLCCLAARTRGAKDKNLLRELEQSYRTNKSGGLVGKIIVLIIIVSFFLG